MQGHDRLEIYYQVSSTLNRLAKDKNLNDLPALENLVDAYLVYTASTQKDLSPVVEKIRADILKKISVRKLLTEPDKLTELAAVISEREMSFLDKKQVLKSLDTIIQAQNLGRELSRQAEAQKAETPAFDEKALDKLLRAAESLAGQDKKAAGKQKSDAAKQEKTKAFLLEEVQKRLAKKAALSPNDEYIAQNLQTLSSVSLKETDGKPAFCLEFGAGKIFSLRVYTKGNAYVFGVSDEALKNKKQTTDLYKALRDSGSLSFGALVTSGGSSSAGQIKDKELKQQLDITAFEMNAGQKAAFRKELSAFNLFKNHGEAKKLTELEELLRRKYQFLQSTDRQDIYKQKQQDLAKIINAQAAALDKNFAAISERCSPEEFVSLLAPAAGNNFEAKSVREDFSALLPKLAADDGKALLSARRQLVEAVKDDRGLWTEVKENYYSLIKERAADNFYKQMTECLFNGEMSVKDALKANSAVLSPEISRLILLRSIELRGLGPDKITDTAIMDRLHKELGFHVRRKKFQVSGNNSMRSKPLTAMLRSLADGRPFSLHGEVKFDNRDRLYINHNKQQFRDLLGNDPNFEPLIGNVLEGRESETSSLSPTPYQKAYKTLGLLAALSPKMDNDKADDLLFSQVYNVSGSSIPSLKARNKWNRDDYLFKTYMEIFHPGESYADNPAQTKKHYHWDDFKKINRSQADLVAKEFEDNAPSPQKLAAVLLAKGQWPAGDEETTVHHNDPLKYAPSTSHPEEFNGSGKLVITVQWKPWEPDFHKLEHLTTIEGLDCHNPYLVAEGDGSYRRFPQCDLKKGMEICYEKPQIQNKNGGFDDIIPENTLMITSSGAKIAYPHLPEHVHNRTLTHARAVAKERE